MKHLPMTVLALALLWPGGADAQSMPCNNAAVVAKQLGSKYEEAPVAFGLQSNGNLLQVYASDKKDTWTVVSTTPNGLSCIVAAGKKWESLPYVSDDPMA